MIEEEDSIEFRKTRAMLDIFENFTAITHYLLKLCNKHNINAQKVGPLLEDNDRLIKILKEGVDID